RRTVSVATAAILGFSLFVFIVLPRGVGENFLGSFGHPMRSGSVTGFTDHVALGDRGVISESPAVVFTVEVRTPAGDSLGNNDRVYYLRGAVLDSYDAVTHVWKTTHHTSNPQP